MGEEDGLRRRRIRRANKLSFKILLNTQEVVEEEEEQPTTTS